MRLRLYVVPASHPSACVEAALRLKGLEYERVDLITVAHKLSQRWRFGADTVPGLKIEGDGRDTEKLVGSRRILRRLDELAPDPPLLPSEPAARADVERAEAWGDETLQPVVRRIVYVALLGKPEAMRSYTEGAKLPIPIGVAMLSAPLVARLGARINGANHARVQVDVRSLPGHLDRVDGWIREGVIGGATPNAADLQIGSSLALLATLEDVGPLLEGRPSADLARRVFPDFPGRTPAGALPADWLPEPATSQPA